MGDVNVELVKQQATEEWRQKVNQQLTQRLQQQQGRQPSSKTVIGGDNGRVDLRKMNLIFFLIPHDHSKQTSPDLLT